MGLDKNLLFIIVKEDAESLIEAERHYGESWCKRGGVDSYMMIARKIDRLEHIVKNTYNWNILEACIKDNRPEGIIDDIRDLRRYLILVEEKIRREHGLYNEPLEKNKLNDEGSEPDHKYTNQG